MGGWSPTAGDYQVYVCIVLVVVSATPRPVFNQLELRRVWIRDSARDKTNIGTTNLLLLLLLILVRYAVNSYNIVLLGNRSISVPVPFTICLSYICDFCL